MAEPNSSRKVQHGDIPYGRQAAISGGFIKYINKKPCKNGHEPIRYTKSTQCCECVRGQSRKRRAEKGKDDDEKRKIKYRENLSENREKHREYYRRNAEKRRQYRREYIAQNYEKVRESKKRYYEKNKDKISAKQKIYHAENREHRNALCREYLKRTGYNKKYHAEHREERNRYCREYGRNNPEVYRAKHARRRSAQKGGVSGPELRAWIREQKKVCYWCGIKCPNGFHVDHYVPLSKGGTHTFDNLVIACRDCNLSKNAKDPYEFANQLGKLF